MKKLSCIALILCLLGCSASPAEDQKVLSEPDTDSLGDEIEIVLSDEEILIDGKTESEFVTISQDIIYYEEGKDETYGEGTAEDAHSKEEADLHTVVTITQEGTYRVTGSLAYGQIVVDLGEDAASDSNAVVNLILDQANLNCTVASAILVLNAYECAEDTKDNPDPNVDLKKAGFNLILENENTVSGSYVAKIYEPGTEEKLHKYDAAIESMVSFNIKGEGSLNLTAQNEGIETKMHLQIHSGNLVIASCDDSLNASEDGVSVIRISGGTVQCSANSGAEGDGIDSNGWLVIEGGIVSAFGNANSMDSGLDSDNGILIHGGTVFATGNMLDEISQESKQNTVILQAMQKVKEGTEILLKQDNASAAVHSEADWTVLVYSSEELMEGAAQLWQIDQPQGQWKAGVMENPSDYAKKARLSVSLGSGFAGMSRPQGMQMPEGDFDPSQMEGFNPGDMNIPEGDFDPSQMEGWSENFEGFDPSQMEDWSGFEGSFDPSQMEGFNPEDMNIPEGDFNFDEMPQKDGGNGMFPTQGVGSMQTEMSTEFELSKGITQLMIQGFVE